MGEKDKERKRKSSILEVSVDDAVTVKVSIESTTSVMTT